ncbi:MAG: serine protease [Enterobacterales bacterium]|jgi:serine protease
MLGSFVVIIHKEYPMISKLTGLSAVVFFILFTSSIIKAEDSRYIIQVNESHKGNVKALARKMGGTINLEAKGFMAATFKGKSLSQVKGLLNNPNITLIEEDFRRYPLALYNDDQGDPTSTQLTDYAVYQSQADQMDLQGGQKVCIIDSGIAGVSPNGETGGQNHDFDWNAITGDSDSGTGDWNADGGPHGTHVAGTVGAADNGIGVRGMAPGVAMHIIKVFNAAGWGYSSDLAHAESLCTAAYANIITMSLGGGGANSTEENAFNSFTNNGGLVLAAAGNDGSNARSYPAGYKSVMMIAANDADNNIADFSQFPSDTVTVGRGRNRTSEKDDGYGVEVSVGGVNTLSTYPAGGATVAALTVDGTGYASSAMENSASISGATYYMGTAEAIDNGANGKICVIDRGVISFHNKVLNCENSGGIGAIIINNEPGMLYGTLGSPNTTSIPAVGATQEDRTVLVAAANASATADISVAAGDYGYMSGTSMATPGAAGIAALIWSNNPNCTGAEVRQAMKDTAEEQGAGAGNRDDNFGYGIVKAVAANNTLSSRCGDGGGDPVGNTPPVASFTADCTLLSCDFNAVLSSDPDGSIATYDWNFGDNTTGTGVEASKTYQANGPYTVTLTVTDDDGATGTSSQTVSVSDGTDPEVSDFTLTGLRSDNNREITIYWSGATGPNVDVYVNENLNSTTANNASNVNSITYRVSKRSTYTFRVCETGSTTNCSNTTEAL